MRGSWRGRSGPYSKSTRRDRSFCYFPLFLQSIVLFHGRGDGTARITKHFDKVLEIRTHRGSCGISRVLRPQLHRMFCPQLIRHPLLWLQCITRGQTLNFASYSLTNNGCLLTLLSLPINSAGSLSSPFHLVCPAHEAEPSSIVETNVKVQ